MQDQDRLVKARATVQSLNRDQPNDPLKICVMIRVKRLFKISLADETFTVMLHVVTSWLAEGDAANDAMDETFVAQNKGQYVYDADPDKAFYEPDFRPRIAIRNLSEGAATLKGSEGEDYFFRSYVDGRTLVTWEVEKLCVIGTLFDLKFYPVCTSRPHCLQSCSTIAPTRTVTHRFCVVPCRLMYRR